MRPLTEISMFAATTPQIKITGKTFGWLISVEILNLSTFKFNSDFFLDMLKNTGHDQELKSRVYHVSC